MDIRAMDAENDKKVADFSKGKVPFYCLIPEEIKKKITETRVKYDEIVKKGLNSVLNSSFSELDVQNEIKALKAANEQKVKAILKLQDYINQLQLQIMGKKMEDKNVLEQKSK